MTNDANETQVVHNEAQNRFEIPLGDDLAMVEYRIYGKNIVFTHTEVPPAYEGKGLAGRIAKTALDYAKDQGYTINPVCPYIKAYIERHPEYHPITFGYF